ncbi:Rpn family recombination-promoting nuclease/putative transposase [Halotia branconii]|uniref:Rpn family recombination-promoting nuclease/putative transposase n=1 Tax=Halotia branconii CENA392 TaxID=1539056 RepID=A0AAJ6NQE3_9CYAN|nr:Rpn family recombination-promoting nuclease/putative transposase [Halotia branconii]WGV24799.1 Rpn family recombination-promoting nuclease/putative transposase [Halotia branconii CENA392]
MAEYDNLCKILAEKHPRDFIRWLLHQEPRQIKILKTELSIEPIRADSVTFLQTENRILHLEFQTTVKSKTPIGLRMLDYYVRLTRQYQVPVTQVMIFLQPTSDEIAFTTEYVSEVTTHRYQVIRMWEQDSVLFLNNLGLLPLAPLTRTDSAPALLSQVATEIAKIPDIETRQNTATYTEILAGLKFEQDLILQLLREETMQESVIYQYILQKGEQNGEQKEALQFCLLLLDERFGEIDASIIERLQVLNKESLEALGRAILKFSSLSDLVTWLNQQEV